MKKLLGYAALGFVVFFIAYRPSEAAGIVGVAVGFLGDVGSGFADFLGGVI